MADNNPGRLEVTTVFASPLDEADPPPRTWAWVRGVLMEDKDNDHLLGLVEIAWRVTCPFTPEATWDWEWY